MRNRHKPTYTRLPKHNDFYDKPPGIYNNKHFRKSRPETAKRSQNYKFINITGPDERRMKKQQHSFSKPRRTHKSTASHDTVPRIKSRE